MRYFLAICSLALSAVLLILGIGQRTFLAQPNTIQETIPLSNQEAAYTVIPAEVLASHRGNPSVITGGEQVFLALGQQRDVEAWVAPFGYVEVGASSEPLAITTQEHEPQPLLEEESESGETTAEESPTDELELLDPRGSDLWLSEYSGETSLKVAVAPEPDQAVLVTAGASPTAPEELVLSWAQERNTPLAGPLLVTGGLFGLLGIVLYIFAVDHDRRGLGPRRGRKGPFQGLRNRRIRQKQSTTPGPKAGSKRGSRLGFAVAALAGVTLSLTACSPSYWPQATQPDEDTEVTQEETENQAVVPVTNDQIDRILDRVVESANSADEALTTDDLTARFSGPAFIEREANYKILSGGAESVSLPHLTQERLDYNLVQSTEKWPRTLLLTIESSDSILADEEAEGGSQDLDEADEEATETIPEPEEETNPTLVLMLTQETPHENYEVNHIVALRGGIEMPAAAPLDEGTAVLANDIKTMKLSPRDTATTFASIMQQGTDNVEGAADFDLEGEVLLEEFGAVWPKNSCKEDMKCSQEVQRTEDPIVTLSTGQGGALVMAALQEKHHMSTGDERSQVGLSDVERAFGLDGSYESVTRSWQHTVLFYVPIAESDEPIKVLGSSTQIIGATGTEKSDE